MRYIVLLLISSFLHINCASSQQHNPTSSVSQSPTIDSQFNDLKWRNIGPFRGGRSVAAAGVVGAPMTYYMGSTGGGVWKTVNDGISWKNISDGFLKTGTVGAIAVAESNPNIVVVGMGEHAARGVMTSTGDGVYKSTDAGRSWKHIGLDETYHISDVIINPTNPQVIYVAAQGAQFGATAQRGVFKSMDGGTTWEKVLYINDITGASGLSMDMNNPDILYASMWEHERKPWTMISGGPNSGIYKSTDGGSSWDQLKTGLPKAFGKSGISVSRANSDRVFAIIEAEGDKSGVYRSDDRGKKWTQVNKDRVNITRSWYYMEIFADPMDENRVYIMNAPAMKSIDGGKSFARMPTPHGDNHDLWINPHDNQKMINANDGGANISNNGGKDWSTQQNQPTSQFYRVITDNLVPYNVYGGQQDNSSIAIVSRTRDGGIDWKDWHSVAGCESAFLAFDPDNPEVVYGGCYQGIIEKYITSKDLYKPIKEYPELGLSIEPKTFKYRYNWNAPIITSPHDRSTIYHAGNVVFKSQDEGQSWTVISPDLTRDNKDQQGPGGKPYTNEAAGGENYNTIMSLVASSHEEGVIWAGSDDGRLHITKNGGTNWSDVTPAGMKEGIINSIEVSPHDPAAAYIVLMRYKFKDLAPYIYKTNDYGTTWTKITKGIEGKHTFPRVVRADKNKKGLLYAGTETGLYMSWNDGASWQKFQLNLPIVPINDLIIQDNDLVAATAGRSFWILDDISLLSKIEDQNEIALQVFHPKDNYRFFGGSSSSSSGIGENPKEGVAIDYYLKENADSSSLKLEIISNDKVIRSYSNQKPKGQKSWAGGPPKPTVLKSEQGYSRFVWDYRNTALPGIEGVFVHGDHRGSRVPPGSYIIRMSLDSSLVMEANLNILPDPNIPATSAQFEEQQSALNQIANTVKAIHEAVNKMRSAKDQINEYQKRFNESDDTKELSALGDSIVKRIDEWERKLIQPDQKTFQDVINFNNQLNSKFLHLKRYIDVEDPQLTAGAKELLIDLTNEWTLLESELQSILSEDLKAYNKLYKSLSLPAIILKE